jgi:hypothetical protein
MKRVAKLARADPIRSRVEFEAGPAANNPGLRAVLRRHAPSATRQRTLEANGIDCGAGPVSEASGVRRERYGSRSTERTGHLGEDRPRSFHLRGPEAPVGRKTALPARYSALSSGGPTSPTFMPFKTEIIEFQSRPDRGMISARAPSP